MHRPKHKKQWRAWLSLAAVFVVTFVSQPSVADTLERHNHAPGRDRKACREQQHRIDVCTAIIEQSRSTPAILAEAYQDRANAFFFHEDYVRAIADYSEAIRIIPDYVEALNGRGFVFARKQQYDLAIADYDAALKAKPDFAAVWANRGHAYLALKNLDHAITDFDEAIKLRPNLVGALFDRGRARRQKGEPDRAIEDFTKAIQLEIRFAPAFENRGLAYGDQNKTDLAIADFTEALEIDPDLTDVRIERGLAYERLGRNELAMQDYDQAIQINPDSAWAFNVRGLAYAAQHKDELAIKDYSEAIRLDPHYSAALNNRGMAYSRYRQWDWAVADFDAAIRENPQNAGAFRNRGYAFKAQSQFDRAIADYDAAIRINPKFAWAFNNRAHAYFSLGQYDRAIEDFDTAIRLTPGYADAIDGRKAALVRKFLSLRSAALFLVILSLRFLLSERAYRKALAWRHALHAQAHIDAQHVIVELTQIRDLLITPAASSETLSLGSPWMSKAVAERPIRENAMAQTPELDRLRKRPTLPTWMTRDVSPRTGVRIIVGGCLLILLVPGVFAVRNLVARADATRRDPLGAFVQFFDEDLTATAPQLMKIAQRDPVFHRAFLERSKQAYAIGGWDAVNTALYPFLEQSIAIYASDAPVFRLAAAHSALLKTLQKSHSSQTCKTLGLAPRTGASLPFNEGFMADLVGGLEAIVTEGGQAKAQGALWSAPSGAEVRALWHRLRDGAQPLSGSETSALQSKANADAQTYCQATIKIIDNILNLPSLEGARAYRIVLAHAEQDDWLVSPAAMPGAPANPP